ncbi:MAG: glycoside hydrolase family 3 N-terminal domain-containing protein [Halioglobus sp.]
MAVAARRFPRASPRPRVGTPALLACFGAALGQECRAVGGRTLLGPVINITRTLLNGRTFEYLSEDLHLNSRLVVPIVKAIQAQGVAACIKHFAANNQETNRVRISAEVSERALQEIYLPAFRAEGDAWAVMSAYNAINGTPASQNRDLLRHKLQHQWGFRGFVVSDWFAARGTTAPGPASRAGSALKCRARVRATDTGTSRPASSCVHRGGAS